MTIDTPAIPDYVTDDFFGLADNWIPTAAGIAAVLAGVGLVFAGKRAA